MLEAARGRLGLRVCRASYIGSRAEQQDAAEVTDEIEAAFLAVLADGMGGMLMGRECAVRAVDAFGEAFAARSSGEIAEALVSAARRTNEVVLDWAAERGAAEETGCTLVCAAVARDRLYWLSVGDSHIYLFREGRLTRLNEEHNLRTRLARSGAQSAEAERYAGANLAALTSFIGIRELAEIDFPDEPLPLAAGDAVLLCSDGLYGSLSGGETAEILSSGAEDPAAALIEAVAAKGFERQDNATAVVIEAGCRKKSAGACAAKRAAADGGAPSILTAAARFLRFVR